MISSIQAFVLHPGSRFASQARIKENYILEICSTAFSRWQYSGEIYGHTFGDFIIHIIRNQEIGHLRVLTHVLYRADSCLAEYISYECDKILKPNK
jgi:hypothetical protein